MPAHYANAELADRGGIARFKAGNLAKRIDQGRACLSAQILLPAASVQVALQASFRKIFRYCGFGLLAFYPSLNLSAR